MARIRHRRVDPEGPVWILIDDLPCRLRENSIVDADVGTLQSDASDEHTREEYSPDRYPPEAKVPEAKVPEVDVPEVDVPEVDVPEVDVSDVEAIRLVADDSRADGALHITPREMLPPSLSLPTLISRFMAATCQLG